MQKKAKKNVNPYSPNFEYRQSHQINTQDMSQSISFSELCTFAFM